VAQSSAGTWFKSAPAPTGQKVDALDEEPEAEAPAQKPETPFTIAEAKRRLACAFGVSEADIKITISS